VGDSIVNLAAEIRSAYLARFALLVLPVPVPVPVPVPAPAPLRRRRLEHCIGGRPSGRHEPRHWTNLSGRPESGGFARVRPPASRLTGAEAESSASQRPANHARPPIVAFAPRPASRAELELELEQVLRLEPAAEREGRGMRGRSRCYLFIKI